MSGRLDGKVALVSGAARGQGRSHAVGLARVGGDGIAFDICAPVREQGAPQATQADLQETVRLVEALDRRIVTATADAAIYMGSRSFAEDGGCPRTPTYLSKSAPFT